MLLEQTDERINVYKTNQCYIRQFTMTSQQ